MPIFTTQPIRRQVVAVAWLVLVPLGVAVAWSANRTHTEAVVEVREQAASIAATAAAALNQYFVSVDAMASMLTRQPAVRALEAEESRHLFADVLRSQPMFVRMSLADRNGRTLADEAGPRRGAATSPAVLAYPVTGDDGAIAGVVSVGFDLDQLPRAFAGVPLPSGSVVTLTERKTDDPNDAALVDLRAGPDGVERFYANAIVGRGPWLLSVGIPQGLVAERLAPLWRRNLGIAAAAVVSVLLLALWITRHASRDLNRLQAAAQRIADGDLSPPAAGPVPNFEFAQLQNAFITMAARLREMRDALDRQVEQERKMRETLQSLQRQVVRQERLAAVGLLVSGVAHELNNPLQAILGTAELLEREPGLSAHTLEEVAFLKTQSGRAREIIRNLSRFSSQQSGPPSSIDLRDVISEVVQLRRRDLDNSSIALDIEMSSMRKVYANFTEVEQVTLNFVINAQQALEASGRSEGRILIRLSDAGKRVRLEVLDNGPGVHPDDEPKLFQPFFTTKPVGKGTGLGLSVSYGIIDSYGGTIGYRNNEWDGAMFFFELPAADNQAPNDRTAVLQGSVPPRV